MVLATFLAVVVVSTSLLMIKSVVMEPKMETSHIIRYGTPGPRRRQTGLTRKKTVLRRRITRPKIRKKIMSSWKIQAKTRSFKVRT